MIMFHLVKTFLHWPLCTFISHQNWKSFCNMILIKIHQSKILIFYINFSNKIRFWFEFSTSFVATNSLFLFRSRLFIIYFFHISFVKPFINNVEIVPRFIPADLRFLLKLAIKWMNYKSWFVWAKSCFTIFF